MSDLYLVTGASSGIGLSICRNLLFSGHRVALLRNSMELNQETTI
ncbi:SDR family NAD(P)-dependent oxidoreductase [Vibrio parahaemolyticus]